MEVVPEVAQVDVEEAVAVEVEDAGRPPDETPAAEGSTRVRPRTSTVAVDSYIGRARAVARATRATTASNTPASAHFWSRPMRR